MTTELLIMQRFCMACLFPGQLVQETEHLFQENPELTECLGSPLVSFEAKCRMIDRCCSPADEELCGGCGQIIKQISF